MTISTRHMDKVLEVDAVSQAARIQGGIYGPAIEDQLRDSPFTMRHYMQAYRCSTLGGWIATRSGGHYATLYTHIDDFVESMRVVTPAGMLETRRLPGSGAGPSPDRMFLGSEGILGIITEAWVRLRKKPTFSASASVRFKTFFDGADAVRDITQAGLYPANCRLLEARRRCPASRGAARRRCWCWPSRAPTTRSTPGWRGRWKSAATMAAWPTRRRRRERPSLGRRRRLAQQVHPRAALRRARRGARHPVVDLRDLDDLGTHARLPPQDHGDRQGHDQARDRARRHRHLPLHPRLSRRALPLFHLRRHSDKRIALEQFMEVLSTCTAATVEHGGTTTHHHAVGRFHRPFYDKQRPELFARALRGAKRELDPKGMMNPGVLIDP